MWFLSFGTPLLSPPVAYPMLAYSERSSGKWHLIVLMAPWQHPVKDDKPLLIVVYVIYPIDIFVNSGPPKQDWFKPCRYSIASCGRCSWLGWVWSLGSWSAPGVSASGSSTGPWTLCFPCGNVNSCIAVSCQTYFLDSISNCSIGSPLWGPRNVGEGMGRPVSITCLVRWVLLLACMW